MRGFLVLVTLAVVSGCKSKTPPPAPPTPATGLAVGAGPVKAPPGGEGAFSGKVAETLEAPGYTYLRLETAGGDLWAAIPTASVAVGRQVTLASGVPMKDFVSKTLNRTFPVIIFASGLEAAGSAPSAYPTPATGGGEDQAIAAAHAPGAVPSTVGAEVIAVEKASGANAVTVKELYQRKAALKDQTVVLRAKVVKYNSGIMGKNWLHLRDGSGSDAASDNDIVVTTTDTAALNDVVSVTGPVHLDRDVGSGYKFAVMIEDAKVAR